MPRNLRPSFETALTRFLRMRPSGVEPPDNHLTGLVKPDTASGLSVSAW